MHILTLRKLIEDGGDVTKADVTEISMMDRLIEFNQSFNQDISKWDVSNADDMYSMFNGATAFNQDISEWDVSNVLNMIKMFEEADSFSQDISKWNINADCNTDRMFGIGRDWEWYLDNLDLVTKYGLGKAIDILNKKEDKMSDETPTNSDEIETSEAEANTPSKMNDLYSTFMMNLELKNQNDFEMLYNITVEGLGLLLSATSDEPNSYLAGTVFNSILCVEISRLDLGIELRYIPSTQSLYAADKEVRCVINILGDEVSANNINGTEEEFDALVDLVMITHKEIIGDVIRSAHKKASDVLGVTTHDENAPNDKEDVNELDPDDDSTSPELEELKEMGRKDKSE